MNKTLTILLLSILLISNSSFAQDTELSNRLIEQFNNYSNSSNLKSGIKNNHLWLTPLLRDVKLNWDNLTPEAQELFKSYNSLPTFQGTEETYQSGIFTFHYSVDGGDSESVSSIDLNNNSVPDYVEDMASVFVNDVYQEYHSVLGYTIPPFGDDETTYHVFISGKEAGQGIYGYVASGSPIGDNPNSSDVVERYSYSSYMVMRNNYTGFGNPDDALKVTAAHEYMHAIQFGIAITMDAWFLEACAVWGEELVFPGLDDNFQYLPYLFLYPDVALNIADGEADGDFDGHWYSTWLFVQYMGEQTNTDIVKHIYNRCINNDPISAIDAELSSNWNTSFSSMFEQFHISNVIMNSNSNFSPYNYVRADDYIDFMNNYGSIVFENDNNKWDFDGTEITWSSSTDGNNQLMRLSSDYFLLSANQSFKIKVSSNDNLDGTNFIVLKIKGDVELSNLEVEYANVSNEVIITDVENWDGFIPMLIRNDEDVTNTNPINYNIVINEDLQSRVKFVENHNIKLSPNPAKTILQITGSNSPEVSVTLTNIVGQEVLNQQLVNNTIDVRPFTNGMYFLTVYENNQIVKIEKVIIAH